MLLITLISNTYPKTLDFPRQTCHTMFIGVERDPTHKSLK